MDIDNQPAKEATPTKGFKSPWDNIKGNSTLTSTNNGDNIPLVELHTEIGEKHEI